MPSPPPKISVVIPVHDRADLLARALQSVLAQTEERWEAIVVDDASDPPVALAALRDPRIRTIRLARNGGPSAARNAGLAAARGAFVAFLDSDDEWRPDKLATQMNALRQGDRILVSGAELVDGARAGRSLPARPKAPDERTAAYLYLANQFAQASCMFAPTAFARAIGFDPHLRQYEDHMFLLRAEAAGAAIEVATTPLTRHHVDPRPDRLGRRDDLRRASEFLHAAGGLLQPHENVAFQLRCMAPEMPPRDAVRLALAALAMRGAPKGAAIKVLARALIGPSAYAAFRGAGRRMRRVTHRSMSPTA